MDVYDIVIMLVGAGVISYVLLSVGPHFWTSGDTGGDADEGVAVFVESIRWLGVRWGMRSAAAGLRRAGFRGEFFYWKWHAGWRGWLVLPAIMDRRLLEREAQRLADFISDRKRVGSGRPVFLLGYSAGGYVMLRALELLPAGVCVDGAAVLAGAFDPRRDLAQAGRAVSRPIVIASSLCDWVILGIGTLIFGTADRRHRPSAGMVGLCGKNRSDANQICWRPAMLRCGHFGGHFTASSRGFVAEYIAPATGITGNAKR